MYCDIIHDAIVQSAVLSRAKVSLLEEISARLLVEFQKYQLKRLGIFKVLIYLARLQGLLRDLNYQHKVV